MEGWLQRWLWQINIFLAFNLYSIFYDNRDTLEKTKDTEKASYMKTNHFMKFIL